MLYYFKEQLPSQFCSSSSKQSEIRLSNIIYNPLSRLPISSHLCLVQCIRKAGGYSAVWIWIILAKEQNAASALDWVQTTSSKMPLRLPDSHSTMTGTALAQLLQMVPAPALPTIFCKWSPGFCKWFPFISRKESRTENSPTAPRKLPDSSPKTPRQLPENTPTTPDNFPGRFSQTAWKSLLPPFSGQPVM